VRLDEKDESAENAPRSVSGLHPLTHDSIRGHEPKSRSRCVKGSLSARPNLEGDMKMIRRQWIGLSVLGLCLLVQGCASDLPYHLALETDPADQKPGCTVVLKSEVEKTLKGDHGPLGGSEWTIRNFQIALERRLDQTVKGLNKVSGCSQKNTPLNEGSVKWLASYAYEATDPDQDLRRFDEYLNSRKLARALIRQVPVVADERVGEVEGVIVSEGACDRRSQWFGNPETKDERTCSTKSRPLYKILSYPDDLTDRLLLRVKEVRSDRIRNARFFVLGYEIPWDEDDTLIRYGMRFYFIDTLTLGKNPFDASKTTTEYLGYELDYANEATPQPILAHSMKNDVPGENTRAYEHDSAREYERDIMAAKTAAPELSNTRRILYWTGYPFAVAIGVKNAVFELAKMPFSAIAGLVSGRDNPFFYPAQNIRTAWNALEVEIGHRPSYYFFPGLVNLISELPFVGQVFQFNTGPKYMDWDFAPEPDRTREKIFLSRGIYGGDKWGQDTGLWAAWARAAYPDYDIYSPPYRHGTITDVLWSMFNLSHGPGYSEAAYIMRHAGQGDRLYLSGHSGGVQRSASASRILANHGYSVQKVVGLAGPNVGQAYVDQRFPNAFHIFLNTDIGDAKDIVSKIGVVAGAYAGALDALTLGPPKYVFGGLAGLFNDHAQLWFYDVFDHLGSRNATISEIGGKVSTLHQTPFRQSLAEPIVFDAYVRSEFSTAFRYDLERPSTEMEFLKGLSNKWFDLDYWVLPGKKKGEEIHDRDHYKEEREGAIPWRRLGH
jgi:hypothetical protein